MKRAPSPAQVAVQVTFILKGHLKNVQLSYLRAAALLARVRDQKLYAALKHPDLESYARQRLNLGRAALLLWRNRTFALGAYKPTSDKEGYVNFLLGHDSAPLIA